MKILVLGPGCQKCDYTKSLIEAVVLELGIRAEVRQVRDVREILEYAVMMTPAVIIDDEEVLVGRVPSKDEVRKWLLSRRPG
jgi:small redox-active disulfide protein 2